MVKDQTAPGQLEAMRRFVNTVDLEVPDAREFLGDGRVATSWLVTEGLLDEGGSLDDAGAEQLRGFREALRMVLLANAGDADEAAAWRSLREFASPVNLGVAVGDRGPELVPNGRGADQVIGRLLAIAYDAVRRGEWRRLKACRKDTCLFAFYDHSKNGSGAWCSMSVCGNRVKAQRRRRREAAA
jgi:predicted RNA-binding Zn ribbon-like protein